MIFTYFIFNSHESSLWMTCCSAIVSHISGHNAMMMNLFAKKINKRRRKGQYVRCDEISISMEPEVFSSRSDWSELIRKQKTEASWKEWKHFQNPKLYYVWRKVQLDCRFTH